MNNKIEKKEKVFENSDESKISSKMSASEISPKKQEILEEVNVSKEKKTGEIPVESEGGVVPPTNPVIEKKAGSTDNFDKNNKMSESEEERSGPKENKDNHVAVEEGNSDTKMQDEGSKSGSDHSGISAEQLITLAVDRDISAFGSSSIGRLALESYSLKSFGPIGLFGGLSNYLLDVPLQTEIVNVDGDGIVDTNVFYRWSDGSLTAEVGSTVLHENLMVPIMTSKDIGSLISTIPSYYYQLRLDSDFSSALKNPFSALDYAKKMKTWLGGRDDTLAFRVATGYGTQIDGGDNHVAYIVSMCRYFWSAVAGNAVGAKANDKYRVSLEYMDVQDPQRWQDLYSKMEVMPVRAVTRSADYTHFLAACCVPGKSVYPNELEVDGAFMSTIWDKMELNFGRRLRVVANDDYQIRDHRPMWVGEPAIIRSYIEQYVRDVGAESQLGEAIRATLVLPYQMLRGEKMTLPLPHHVADYFATLFIPSSEESPFCTVNDAGPFQQIVTGYFVDSMVQEAETSIVESVMYERNTPVVSKEDMSILSRVLSLARAKGEQTIVSMISMITGVCMDFLLQFGYGRVALRRMIIKANTVVGNALAKMMIKIPMRGTTSHLLRRGELMSTEAETMRGVRMPWETSFILNKLGFVDGNEDITGRFNQYTWNTTMKVSLQIHNDRKLWFNAIKNKTCRLYLEYFDFGASKRIISSKDVEDDYDRFMQELNADFERAGLNVKVPVYEVPETLAFTETFKTVFSRDKSGKVRLNLAGVDETAPLNSDEIDRWNDEDKRSLMTAIEGNRAFAKEQVANSIYMATPSSNALAKSYYDACNWKEVECGGGGDCGPLVFLKALEQSKFSSKQSLNVMRLRREVCGLQKLDVYQKEWWLDSDFTAAGSLYGKFVILHFTLSNGEDWVRALTPITQERDIDVVVIRNVGNFHWVLLNKDDSSPAFRKWLLLKADEDKQNKEKLDLEREKSLPRKGGGESGASELISDVETKFKVAEATSNAKGALSSRLNLKPADKRWLVQAVSLLRSAAKRVPVAVVSQDIVEAMADRCFPMTKVTAGNGKRIMGGIGLYYDELSGLSPHVPCWVVEFRKVYDTSNSWQAVEMLLEQGAIDKDLASAWHCILFPYSPLPLKMAAPGLTVRHESSGCGCYFCNLRSVNWTCCPSNGFLCRNKLDELDCYESVGKIENLLPKRLNGPLGKKVWRAIDSKYPYGASTGKKKANVSVGSVLKAFSSGTDICLSMWSGIRKFLIRSVGARNCLIAGRLMWLIGNTCGPSGHVVANAMGVVGCCSMHWVDTMKEAHEEIRSNRSYAGYALEPMDHSQLLYFHLLFGRVDKDVDWSEEEKIRTSNSSKKLAWDGRNWSSSLGDIIIKQELQKIMKSFRRRGKLESFKDRFRSRASWMAGGAAPRKGKTMNADAATEYCGIKVKLSELKGNKRSWSERVGAKDVLNWLDKEPVQRAYAHKKGNELAKVRAIYGTETEHYLLEDHEIEVFERCFSNKAVDLKESGARAAASVLQRQMWSASCCETNSYDFKGFNEQHQHKHLAMVHECIRERVSMEFAGDVNLSEYEKISKWVEASYLNQMYYEKESDKWIKTTNGMFSGCRATTVNNTLLNIAYIGLARKNYIAIYGKDPILDSWHHGDDMIARTPNHSCNANFNSVAIATGLEASRSKLLSDSGYMEYLRLLYYPEGYVLGSLNRAVAAFVSGNWETEMDPDPASRASAIWDECSVLMRRGLKLSLVLSIQEDLTKFLTPTYSQGIISDGLDMRVVRLSKANGGLGLGSLGSGEVLDGVVIQSEDDGRDEMENIPDGVLRRATDDYLAYVNSEILPRNAKIEGDDKERFCKVIFKSTAGTELPRRVGRCRFGPKRVRMSNNAVRNSKLRVKNFNKTMPLASLSSILRPKGESRKLEREINRYERLKVPVSYCSTRMMNRKAIWSELKVSKAAIDIAARKDESDRTDGGCLPPQFVSAIISYAAMFSGDPDLTGVIAKRIAKDERMVKIKY